MNVQQLRQLREALDVWIPEYVQVLARRDDLLMQPLEAIEAAARQTLDRWQECGECEGGRVRLHDDPLPDFGDFGPCPRCGGSGVLPNPVRLKQASIAIHDYEARPRTTRNLAEAAVRAFDKETTE